MKFHDNRCKGKAVMAGNPNAAGRTDGHGDSSIPPPNFVAGGINILCKTRNHTHLQLEIFDRTLT